MRLLMRRVRGYRRRLCGALAIVAFALIAGPLAAQPVSVPMPEDARGSPVAQAAKQGDRQTVEALLRQGLDADGWGADGTPALHWAVRVDDRDMTAVLLAAGADVDGANRYGQAPIHVAVQHRHAAMVRQLLEAGANPELADGSGEPPLLLATRLADLDIL